MERFAKFDIQFSFTGKKRKKEKKKDPMHEFELTIYHLGKSRYAHCSMQAHFWGPKCFIYKKSLGGVFAQARLFGVQRANREIAAAD